MTDKILDAKPDVPETKRSRLRSLMGVRVLSTGSYVPDNVVRNEDLAALGYDADWIVQRTGILERRHAPEGVSTSDLAVEAARRCIERAGVDPGDIDLVLVGTFTPDMPLPATACQVQDRLGLCAPAMDIQAACAGFIYAMITGMQYVAAGCSQLALVVGADCNSRIVNPADKHTYPLFGDGAGAVLLAPGDDRQGMVAFAWGADGSGAGLLCRPMGGSRMPPSAAMMAKGLHWLHMEGRPVFKWAIRLLSETVNEVCAAAGISVQDVDLVIFHQANIRIIDAAIDDLKLDRKKVLNNLDRYGNTSAGSVPLAMDEACEKGLIKPGDRVILTGFGAGLAWGTVLLQW
jgi:3-oxoacyl-[acyl-carrier-protein] synthase III